MLPSPAVVALVAEVLKYLQLCLKISPYIVDTNMEHTLQSVLICRVVGQHSEKVGKARTPSGRELSGL